MNTGGNALPVSKASVGLELTDVSVTIGADKLLSGISLRAEPGTITGLIGRNGSGKTMLLRAICGLVPLAQGEVVVAGQRVGKDVDFPDSIGVIIETRASCRSTLRLKTSRYLRGFATG